MKGEKSKKTENYWYSKFSYKGKKYYQITIIKQYIKVNILFIIVLNKIQIPKH